MALFDEGVPKKYLSGQLAWFICWAIVTLIGVVLKPNPHHHGTHTELGLPPCPCVVLFHRPCPGCGLTTSWTETLHGNLNAALTAHPLGPALYLIFSVIAVTGFVGYLQGKKLRTYTKSANWLLSGILVGVLAVGIARFSTVVYSDPLPPPYDLMSSLLSGKQSGQATRVPKEDPAPNFASPSQLK